MNWLSDVFEENRTKALAEAKELERAEAQRIAAYRSFVLTNGPLIRTRLNEIGRQAFANLPHHSGEYVVAENEPIPDEVHNWGCDSVERSKSQVAFRGYDPDITYRPWAVVWATYLVHYASRKFQTKATVTVMVYKDPVSSDTTRSLSIDADYFTDQWLTATFLQLTRE